MNQQEIYSKHFAACYDLICEDNDYYDYDAIATTITQHADGNSILELGIGTGNLAARLTEHGYDVTGVDTSQDMLRALNDKHGDAQIQAEHVNAAAMQLDDEYDAAVSNGGPLTGFHTPEGPRIDVPSEDALRRILRRCHEHLADDAPLLITLEDNDERTVQLNDELRYERRIKSNKNPVQRTHTVYKDHEVFAELTVERQRLTPGQVSQHLQSHGFTELTVHEADNIAEAKHSTTQTL